MRPLRVDTSEDRELVYREHFEDRRREYLKTLVTPAIIEEHHANPWGQHSEPLERLLIYFRQIPLANKYAVKTIVPFARYSIVALPGRRGAIPKPVGSEEYSSAREATHAIFLLFIRDLLES